MSFVRVSTSAAPKRTADAERRAHIVAAAERAFVRFGFHATTMQNVAEEAGMSAGNLYRYFPSKEAIVEGLCMADQVQRTELFSELIGRLDLREALATTLREHLLSRPTEKARMIVEIWAEAGRNPRVAAITAAVDADVLAGLTKVLHAVGAAARRRRRSIPSSPRESSSRWSADCSSDSRSSPTSIARPQAPWRWAFSRLCSRARWRRRWAK